MHFRYEGRVYQDIAHIRFIASQQSYLDLSLDPASRYNSQFFNVRLANTLILVL